MYQLNNLKPARGAKKNRKRIGRGPGSGHGTTATRGSNGQKSRAGGSRKGWFEGGQMPLYRRVPKRGFKPLRRVEYQVVNVGQLAAVEESEISPESLRSRGLIGTLRRPVKVLAVGNLDRALTVRAHAFSAAARAKIESAGGRAEVVDERSDSGQSD